MADVEASARYYARVFGFGIDYAPGTPPQFAIVTRDGFAVMLRRVGNPTLISPNEKQGGTWDAFFWVRDADALFAELRAKGADVVYEPIVREYGMREFAVRDSDGHVLGFGQDVSRERRTD